MLSQPVLYDNLEGCDREGSGRGFERERIHVYLWPIHADLQQKTSHCKVIALQLKIIIELKIFL